MQKDQIDQGLSFKKKARRRLVGAVALVFLMIVILPMLLEDREKTPFQEEIEIVIPSQEMVAEAPQETPVIQAPVDVDSSVNEIVELELPKVVPQSKPKAVEVKKTEAPKKVAEVKPKAPAPKKAEPKKVEAKKSPAKPKEKPKAKSTSNSNKYYVQIGVFSDPENVKKLKVKLEELGYKSVTEKMKSSTGTKTRLRTEAFDGRNEAAIALENIKDQGLTGMVVNQK